MNRVISHRLPGMISKRLGGGFGIVRSFVTLGIRREDPSRVWERRAPLTPEAISQLKRDVSKRGEELRVLVQTCRRRCFDDAQYTKAGAEVVEDLSEADVVLGLKEPPVDTVHKLTSIPKQRRWMMFSHTHKGQEYNVPLLSAFMDPTKGQTLIDHELLTVPSGSGFKRVAAFGWFAGAVGAGEALSLTGLGLLRRGIFHPLLHLSRPYTFRSLDAFKAALADVGREVAVSPPTKAPIVIGLTGAGNVSEGARAMLDSLGAKWVEPEQLPTLEISPTIYACAITPRSYLQRKDGGYDRSQYYASPELYHSVFAEKIAPYISCIINGAGWQNGFPRILSDSEMVKLTQGGDQNLVAVQDVSCDMKGGLEFVDRHTTIDTPWFEGPGGILVGSTDILPSELPADASRHFSQRIYPYVLRAVSPPECSPDAIDETIKRATIVDDGQLTTAHQWLNHKVTTWRQSNETPSTLSSTTNYSVPSQRKEKKKILLLGSGLVAGPAVEVFLSRPDIALTIASNNLNEANFLSRGQADTSLLDVSNEENLSKAVLNTDIVVSLLPAPLHVKVAKYCIKHGKNLVTASYISPEMRALDASAKEAGVTLLGECGLDPGIDSMAAMRILGRAAKEGRKVHSFVSWCGGLPEPIAADVPLGYKFSWSPKAVLTAALNEARFKLDGQVHTINGDELLANRFEDVRLWKGLRLEGLANRDSLPYVDKYNLGQLSDIGTVLRGTLRYPGFSMTLEILRQLGLLSSLPLTPVKSLNSWAELLGACVGREEGLDLKRVGDIEAYVRMVVARVGGDEEQIEALRWLSLLPSPSSESSQLPIFFSPNAAPIDYLAQLLSSKLSYATNEHDLVLLHHAFQLSTPSPNTSPNLNPDHESDPLRPFDHQPIPLLNVTASLACTGSSKSSAMAKTVGATLALSTLRVIDGYLGQGRGVIGPYERGVWEGVLEGLEEMGVIVEEKWGVSGESVKWPIWTGMGVKGSETEV